MASTTINDPQRFGQTWDLSTFIGYNNQDYAPTDEVIAAIAADADVTAVNDVRLDVAQIAGAAVSVLTLDPVNQPLDIVLTKGTIASKPGEITIGPRTGGGNRAGCRRYRRGPRLGRG